MTRILAQDVAEQLLGLAALIGEERRRRFLDARALWIGEARALECDSSLLILSKIDERVAVGEPGAVMMGLRVQYPPHLCARLIGAAGAPVGPCEIHARVGEFRSGHEHTLERLDTGGDSLLVEECGAEEPQTVDLARKARLERPQPRFRSGRPP